MQEEIARQSAADLDAFLDVLDESGLIQRTVSEETDLTATEAVSQ